MWRPAAPREMRSRLRQRNSRRAPDILPIGGTLARRAKRFLNPETAARKPRRTWRSRASNKEVTTKDAKSAKTMQERKNRGGHACESRWGLPSDSIPNPAREDGGIERQDGGNWHLAHCQQRDYCTSHPSTFARRAARGLESETAFLIKL